MPPPHAVTAVDATFAMLGEEGVYRRSGQPDLTLQVHVERDVPIVGIARAEVQQQAEFYRVRDADLGAAGLLPPVKGDEIELAPGGVPNGKPRRVQGEPALLDGDLVWRLDMVSPDPVGP